MVRIFAAALALLALAFSATAQQDDRPDTILVLDASGSMWGQIDGINKIVIAREVIAEVLTDLPAELDLGLMAYGHNRRGDCSDIEMLIEPGPATRGAIVDAVNSINPRGRTPMTDAVVAAARALRFTENPATVILVSDGIETCDADPCAIAQELEASGVGFTAHVIGFDVAAEPEARAQMQCLAENTGGEFLTADNAEELAAALTQVAAAPPAPPPALVTVTAEVEPDGTPPVSPLTWTLRTASGETLLGPVDVPGFNVELAAGDYVVEVLRQTQGTIHSAAFSVTEGEQLAVVVPLPAILTEVTFEARLDTADGPLISDPVIWTVAGGSEASGNPLVAEMASGAYDIEAYWTVAEQTRTAQISVLGADARTVVLVFETPLPTATLVAPESAPVGSMIEVAWEGPGAEPDFVGIVPAGEESYRTYAYLRDGNPVSIRVPSQPGAYEIRYFQRTGGEPLASVPLTATPVTATLIAPDTAIAGSTVEVAWEGPDYDPDYIAVSEPGEPTHVNYRLTREGSPAELVMPAEPGTYEIRYVMQVDREVIATRMIEVTDVLATLDAPASAVAGSTIPVMWEGPDYQNDYISVAAPDDDTGYENYTYTREGAPLDLVMPTEPGTYEIRYVVSQDRVTIATRTIEVTPVGASVSAPETAVAGSTIEVSWEGPNYQNDYVSVAHPEDDTGYVNYTYTREGAPLDLVMPTEPGTYEIRYTTNQNREILARQTIEITSVAAALVAPDTAIAGAEIEIAWEGPDYQNDYVSVAEPGDDSGYVNYTYTREGSPLDLTMPTEPGTYEIRYVLNQDRRIIAVRTIEVTSVAASLVAPDTAIAGSSIEVAWDGPDYQNDYISVAAPDDRTGYVNYTYTREGSPLDLVMPTEPGTYEIRYVMNQDREAIAVRQIEVTALSVSLTTPATAVVGDTVEIGWNGPDYPNDFIAISDPGDRSGYLNYTYTREGNPLGLTMPSQPGTYEIRYFLNQDRTIAASAMITVEDLTGVTIDAPATATAGSQIQIRYIGPDYPSDYIAFGVPGDDGTYTTYQYTRDGNPMTINVPDEAGSYELRYYMRQDNRIIARREITVE